jgi:DNA-binding MarR family transcriptional regulator
VTKVTFPDIICMCYTYHVSDAGQYEQLDELLVRLRTARQRHAWRRGSIEPSDGITRFSTLRVLKAVELAESAERNASVRDVAAYTAVEHSTASRAVASAVRAGLLEKSTATEDQRRCLLALTEAGRAALAEAAELRRIAIAETVADWSDGDIQTLLSLLERLASDFERGVN